MLDFVGPLGMATEYDRYKKSAVIGRIRYRHSISANQKIASMGVDTDAIIGFRNKDLVILEDEIKEKCHPFACYLPMTDPTAKKGFVTDVLKKANRIRCQI